MRFTLISLDNFDFLQEGSIPLPKKTTLTWVGFSSDGTPAMYDSTGLLSVLDKHRKSGQARWVPVLDSVSLKKEGRSDSYWPVGVTEARMACIILKVSNDQEIAFSADPNSKFLGLGERALVPKTADSGSRAADASSKH